MSDKPALYLVAVGLLMTFGGVGGVENSLSDIELVQSFLVALVGLAVMGCGVLAINTQQNG